MKRKLGFETKYVRAGWSMDLTDSSLGTRQLAGASYISLKE
jgi:hypothetical protein